MKNSQKGFVVPLLIVIALIVIGSGVYLYKTKKVETPVVTNTGTQESIPAPTVTTPETIVKDVQKTNTSAPVVNQTQTTKTTGTVTDPWTALNKLNTALKNSDIAGYNSISYKSVPSSMAAQFSKMAPFLYSQSSNLNETDFINKWQDDKQAIYSTAPKKDDTVDSYGYTQSLVFFIKGQDGSWKVLSVNPQKGWSVSKKGTNETAAQVEQDLQKMMLDSDRDGITDMDETCGGAQQYNSKCVKTDPNKRDTNGNGLWDGIEAQTKS